MMTYEDCLAFLYDSLPMFQRSGKAAYKANLDNTHRLDQLFGFPHRTFKSVHVAGTNGKGSVCHMLASVFQEAGYRTGLYTSPHLLDFRERIRINGEMMAKEEVVHFVEKWQHTLHEISPSFFEMTVAMAFDYFSKMKVDVAIIETGMGGRLDSTNIIQPELSIITNISLDHTEFLGSTLQDIAFEKAGIIKQNRPCLSGSEFPEVNAVIEAVAAEKKSPLILVEKERKFQFQTYKPGGSASFFYKLRGTDSMTSVETDLTGAYQAGNISIVLSAIGQLNKGNWDLSEEAVQKGLQKVRENTGIRGRWETLGSNPRILCDTAHNEAGIEAIFLQLKQLPYKNLHIVWGMVSDKSLDRILKLLPMEARYYFTQASIPRAMPVNILAGKALEAGLSGGSYLSVERAYAAAQEAADPQDLIFIGGSTFVVADLLESL